MRDRLVADFLKAVESKIYEKNGRTKTPRPLTREDIKGVISQVEILRSLSVDHLLEVGVEALSDPKALQNISIAAGLKTDYKPKELGAKAPEVKDPVSKGAALYFYDDPASGKLLEREVL